MNEHPERKMNKREKQRAYNIYQEFINPHTDKNSGVPIIVGTPPLFLYFVTVFKSAE